MTNKASTINAITLHRCYIYSVNYIENEPRNGRRPIEAGTVEKHLSLSAHATAESTQ